MARLLDPLDTLDRQSLVDSRGVTFKAFRETLRPRYGRVWRDIVSGQVTLLAAIAGSVAVQRWAPAFAAAAVPVGAFVVGYTMAYLQLFFHEAAHFNLAASRARNDALANLLIGCLVGQDIRQYRVIHFDHHRFLGTEKDTERSYFEALSPRFIVESLTGIRVLKVLGGREKVAGAKKDAAKPKASLLNSQLLLGLAIHVALLGAALLLHQWTLVAVWLLGMGVVFPFFGSVRQVLEHRSEEARADVDYRVVPHGAVGRLFGDGVIASTLGGAGFNRHLLHHWEPQLSYTRLAELEAYLRETQAADAIRARSTSYGATFRSLLRSNRVDARR